MNMYLILEFFKSQVFMSIIWLLEADPEVRRITIDYEAALWSVLRRLFPGVRLLGCAFHWTQALWRKIQELGLQVPYTHDDATYKFLRKVMSLPFLPADNIPRAFERLRQNVTSQPVLEFLQNGSFWSPYIYTLECIYGRRANEQQHRRVA